MLPLRDWSVLDRDNLDGWFEGNLANHSATARARPAPTAGTASQAVPAVWNQ